MPSTAPAAAPGACAHTDEARLRGTGCTVEAAARCDVRYVTFRVVANDKYLAPRELGVVFAAVRSRFKRERSAPWERFTWRVVPMQGEWVQLQHVLTGKPRGMSAGPDCTSWWRHSPPATLGLLGWLPRRPAAMRTRNEPSSRAAPHARLRCVPEARPKRQSSAASPSPSRWLRLVSPPSAEQWVVKVERDRASFGKQTWWRIEGDAPAGAAAGERTVRLQAHARRLPREIPTSRDT